MKTSPTSRTIQHLKKLGYPVGRTEHWQPVKNHPAGGVRQDLFNFIDLIYICPATCREDQGLMWYLCSGIVAVQCTSGTNHSDRVKKILSIPAAKSWIQAGGKIEVWSWSKKGPRGGRKIWTDRIQQITEKDFPSPAPAKLIPSPSEEPF